MGNRTSKRLSVRDYRQPGRYFITICTHGRAHYFGKCKEGEMLLSPIGKITHDLWFTIPQHHQEVELGAFVVMPNHLHGIIEIKPSDTAVWNAKTQTTSAFGTKEYYQQIGAKAGSLSQIVGSYKSSITREVRKRGFSFEWQKSFHDHVIRKGEEEKIRSYIENNPKTWKEDGFYSSDVGGW